MTDSFRGSRLAVDRWDDLGRETGDFVAFVPMY